MGKNKELNNFINNSASLILVVISLVVLAITFLPGVAKSVIVDGKAVQQTISSSVLMFPGGNIVFGIQLKFSILVVLAFLLPLFASTLVGLLLPYKFIKSIIIGVVFLVSAVLIFLLPLLSPSLASAGFKLGYGSIISAVLLLIGCGVSVLSVLAALGEKEN